MARRKVRKSKGRKETNARPGHQDRRRCGHGRSHEEQEESEAEERRIMTARKEDYDNVRVDDRNSSLGSSIARIGGDGDHGDQCDEL
jgi:hypothetical protein